MPVTSTSGTSSQASGLAGSSSLMTTKPLRRGRRGRSPRRPGRRGRRAWRGRARWLRVSGSRGRRAQAARSASGEEALHGAARAVAADHGVVLARAVTRHSACQRGQRGEVVADAVGVGRAVVAGGRRRLVGVEAVEEAAVLEEDVDRSLPRRRARGSGGWPASAGCPRRPACPPRRRRGPRAPGAKRASPVSVPVRPARTSSMLRSSAQAPAKERSRMTPRLCRVGGETIRAACQPRKARR